MSNRAHANLSRNFADVGSRRGQTSKSGVVNRVAFVSGSEYPDELHLLLKNEVMIRRLKRNVVKQLPPLR